MQNKVTFRRLNILFLVAIICIGSFATINVSAAEARTTILASDDTMDYVTGSKTYYFSLEDIDEGTDTDTYLITVSYFYEDATHHQEGTMTFYDLDTGRRMGAVNLLHLNTTSPRAMLTLTPGRNYRVVFEPYKSNSTYMLAFNIYY